MPAGDDQHDRRNAEPLAAARLGTGWHGAVIATRPESKKLSYKLQRELDRLPAEISQLEKKLAMIHEQMADPGFYQSPAAEIAAVSSRAAVIQAELNAAFRRWEELEAQAAG